MRTTLPADTSTFFLAGINYKKTDASTRGLFSINSDHYESILRGAHLFKIDSLFILSTCNRTEIYGFADSADQLIALLCTQTKGTKEKFIELAYTKNGHEAIEHLFNVGSGLDSQILGDYEITGQIKHAVKFSKDRGFMNCFLERLVNCVLQASKMIKNDTALSGGSVSVSFAAVQYIKENILSRTGKKILVVGIGKIGRNTCKNLVDYLGTTNITLINRSEAKAAELAAELNLQHAPLASLAGHVQSADIILVASNASEPIILSSQLENCGEKLIIDLSIPYNVEASAQNLPNIRLMNVDTLAKFKDETLQKREMEIPYAKKIISTQMAAFNHWCLMRKNAAALNAVKGKLNELFLTHRFLMSGNVTVCPMRAVEANIQRVVNGMAGKMRVQNQQGCHYIEAINEFMNIAM